MWPLENEKRSKNKNVKKRVLIKIIKNVKTYRGPTLILTLKSY